jgi:hypothetical protein
VVTRQATVKKVLEVYAIASPPLDGSSTLEFRRAWRV